MFDVVCFCGDGLFSFLLGDQFFCFGRRHTPFPEEEEEGLAMFGTGPRRGCYNIYAEFATMYKKFDVNSCTMKKYPLAVAMQQKMAPYTTLPVLSF